MTQHCRQCERKRPEYIADPSCSKGGYCEWVEVASAQDTYRSWCPETDQKCTEKRCTGANCKKARQRQIKEEGAEYDAEQAMDYVSAYPVEPMPSSGWHRLRTVDCCGGLKGVCLHPGTPGHEPVEKPKSKAYPIDAPWLTPNQPRAVGQRLTWSFQGPAVIDGFEVEGKPTDAIQGRDFNGFLTSLLVGNCEYLHIGPYPISMFSPGMPPVTLWLPHVPIGVYLSVGLDYFQGKIRPIGKVILKE